MNRLKEKTYIRNTRQLIERQGVDNTLDVHSTPDVHSSFHPNRNILPPIGGAFVDADQYNFLHRLRPSRLGMANYKMSKEQKGNNSQDDILVSLGGHKNTSIRVSAIIVHNTAPANREARE